MKWDDSRIISIVNKSTGNELLCESGGELGQPVYQVFENADRWELAGFGYSARKIPEDKIFYGKSLGVEVLSTGEITTTIRIGYEIRSTKNAIRILYFITSFRELT